MPVFDELYSLFTTTLARWQFPFYEAPAEAPVDPEVEAEVEAWIEAEEAEGLEEEAETEIEEAVAPSEVIHEAEAETLAHPQPPTQAEAPAPSQAPTQAEAPAPSQLDTQAEALAPAPSQAPPAVSLAPARPMKQFTRRARVSGKIDAPGSSQDLPEATWEEVPSVPVEIIPEPATEPTLPDTVDASQSAPAATQITQGEGVRGRGRGGERGRVRGRDVTTQTSHAGASTQAEGRPHRQKKPKVMFDI